MKSPTEKHQELTTELVRVINTFHEENPTLFVNDISIRSAQYPSREKTLTGIDIEILVQPDLVLKEQTKQL